MAPTVTAVEVDDLLELTAADEEYARRVGVEQVVDTASLHFFQRSGHSFVARSAGTAVGFVLAHATWTGARPALRIERLAVTGVGDIGARAAGVALIEAVIKSAYDSGVYDLQAALPEGDAVAADVLAVTAFLPSPARLFERVLGSRSRAARERVAQSTQTGDRGGMIG